MNESALDSEIKVGKILEAEKFEEARKPKLAKLVIDLGGEMTSMSSKALRFSVRQVSAK